MKIAIESQRIFRSHKHGMDVVAMELIRQIQQLDGSNEYTLYAKKGPDLNCVQQTPNFKIKVLKSISYGDWEQLSLPAALHKSKPHLLHCTANTAPIYCPVPLVLTLHDIIFLQETSFRGSAYQNFGNIYRRLVVPSAINRARAIITVSEEERKVIINSCRVDPAKVTVVHNAVSERFMTSHSSAEIDQFRARYSLPASFILHLGNTAPKKNTARMIQAYVNYAQTERDALPLVLVDYSRDLLMRYLSQYNATMLSGNFILPGYISSSEMPLLYRAATVFVYPSLLESFGLPVLESMASGTAVITSEVPALREVGGTAAVYVDPGSATSICQAIRDLLNDEEQIKTLKSAGLDRARQFSWRNSAAKLIGVYQSVLT